jgi:serine phosphatase RsbU (regulator of sigma subunit)
LDPAAVLTGLNTALCGKFQRHFITAAYVLIDTEKRRVRYAGAGHPPLLLREQQTGGARQAVQNGLILGWLPGATYSAAEASFQEGDWLLLYTDGIPETTNSADEQYGEERMQAFLVEHAEGTAADFADGLLQDRAQWTGRAQAQDPDDDVTLIPVHFRL